MKTKEIIEAFDLGETLYEKFSTMIEADHPGKKKYCGIAAILLWMSLPLKERERRVKLVYHPKRKEWAGQKEEMKALVQAAIDQLSLEEVEECLENTRRLSRKSGALRRARRTE